MSDLNIPPAASEQQPNHLTICSPVKDETHTKSHISTSKTKTSSKRVKQPNLKRSVSNTDHSQPMEVVTISDSKNENSNLHISNSESSFGQNKLSTNTSNVSTKNSFERNEVSKSEIVYSTNPSSNCIENLPTSICIADSDNERDTTNLDHGSEKSTINAPSDDSEQLPITTCIATHVGETVEPKIERNTCTHADDDNTLAEKLNSNIQDNAIGHPSTYMNHCSEKLPDNTIELPLTCVFEGDDCKRKVSPRTVGDNEVHSSTRALTADDSSARSHLATTKSRRSPKRAKQPNMKLCSESSENAQTGGRSSSHSDNRMKKSKLRASNSESSFGQNKVSTNPSNVSTKNSFERNEVSKSEIVYSTNSSSNCIENLLTSVCIADSDNERDTTNLDHGSEKSTINAPSDDSEQLPITTCIATHVGETVDPKIERNTCTHADDDNTLAEKLNSNIQDNAMGHPSTYMNHYYEKLTDNTIELPLTRIFEGGDCIRKVSPRTVGDNEVHSSTRALTADDSSARSHLATTKSRRSPKRAKQSNMKLCYGSSENAQTGGRSSSHSDNRMKKSKIRASKSESSCSAKSSTVNPKEPTIGNSFVEGDVLSVCPSKIESECSKNLHTDNNGSSIVDTCVEPNVNKRKHKPMLKMEKSDSTKLPDGTEKLRRRISLSVADGKSKKSNLISDNKTSFGSNSPSTDIKKAPTSSRHKHGGNNRADANLNASKIDASCRKNMSSDNTELAPKSTYSSSAVNEKKGNSQNGESQKNDTCIYSAKKKKVFRSSNSAISNDTSDQTNLNILEKHAYDKSTIMSSTNQEEAQRSNTLSTTNGRREKSNLCNSQSDIACKIIVEPSESVSSVHSDQTLTSTSHAVNDNVGGHNSKLFRSKSYNSCNLCVELRKNKLPKKAEEALINVCPIYDKPKELVSLKKSKSDTLCKKGKQPNTNTPQLDITPQSKGKNSKIELHEQKTSVILFKNEQSSCCKMSSSEHGQLKCSEMKIGGRKKNKFRRSKSVGSSLKDQYSDKSSSDNERANVQRKKQTLARYKRRISKCSSLNKLKETEQETLDNGVISIADKFITKSAPAISIRDNEANKVECSPFVKCFRNENLSVDKANMKSLKVANSVTPCVNTCTQGGNGVVVRSTLPIDDLLENERKTDNIHESEGTNTKDETKQSNSSKIQNDHKEMKSEDISTKKSRRRRKINFIESQQKETVTKSAGVVSSSLSTSTTPTDTHNEQRSRCTEKTRPPRARRKSSRRTSTTNSENVNDVSNALENDNGDCKPIGEDSGSGTSNECRSNPSTSTRSKGFLRMLFTSIARFFGRKEIKPKIEVTSKTDEVSSLVSKSDINTSPGVSVTNIQEQKELQEMSGGKQHRGENTPPISVSSKYTRKHKNGLKSILKKRPTSQDICSQNTHNDGLSCPSMNDANHIAIAHREHTLSTSTSVNFMKANISKVAVATKSSLSTPTTFSTGSSRSYIHSSGSSSDKLGHGSLPTPFWQPYRPPFKHYRRYPLGGYRGRFKSVLSTVKESEEVVFRRHSEEDLTALRKMSEEERFYLENNLADCDGNDAKGINKKLRLMLRHKGIKVENLRAVLRLREKLLCRNADVILHLKRQLLIAEMRIQRLCEMFLHLKREHNEQVTRARELEVELREVIVAVKALPALTGKKRPTVVDKLVEEVKKNARLVEENARLRKYMASLANDKDVRFEAFNFN